MEHPNARIPQGGKPSNARTLLPERTSERFLPSVWNTRTVELPNRRMLFSASTLELSNAFA
jgi:hypothetical protein